LSIESIAIKLRRKGAGIKPDYSLTLYGNGVVLYEGYENVGIKGKIEEQIDKDKTMAILREFKNSDFFSLNDVYPVDGNKDVPYIFISISIKDESGEIKTKSISHYEGDQNVPKELLGLENKIDEITGSHKWVNVPNVVTIKSDLQKEELSDKSFEKKSSRIIKKKPLKLIAVVIIILVIVSAVGLGYNLGFIQIFNSDHSDLDYEPPEIVLITTASYVNGCDYTEKNEFQQGEIIYVYYLFSNVSHNNNYSISEEITISHDGEEVAQYNNDFKSFTESNLFCDSCNFSTDESWPAGQYTVVFQLFDDITKKTANNQTTFNMSESISSLLSSSITTDPINLIGASPFTVKFYSNVTGGKSPYKWEWDFDYDFLNFTVDSTEQNPLHTFESEENDFFYVKLRVTDKNEEIDEKLEVVYLENS